MQVIIHLKEDVKSEPKQSLTKRCALGIFKTVRAAASAAQGAPGQLASSFNEVRDAWIETRPNV